MPAERIGRRRQNIRAHLSTDPFDPHPQAAYILTIYYVWSVCMSFAAYATGRDDVHDKGRTGA